MKLYYIYNVDDFTLLLHIHRPVMNKRLKMKIICLAEIVRAMPWA